MKKTNPMLDLFFTEAKKKISVLNENIPALSASNNKKEINNLLTSCRSLKSAAKLASLDIIFELTQAQENVFSSVSQGSLVPIKKHITIINKSVKLLSHLIKGDIDHIDDWIEKNKP
jgi:chemotaxis protein histidine kinase CheA